MYEAFAAGISALIRQQYLDTLSPAEREAFLKTEREEELISLRRREVRALEEIARRPTPSPYHNVEKETRNFFWFL